MSASLLIEAKTKIKKLITAPISDCTAIRIGIICSLKNEKELLECSLTGTIQTECLSKSEELVLNPNLFVYIFEETACTPSKMLREFVQTHEFLKIQEQIESALSNTLRENVQSKKWKSPITRTAAVLCLFRKNDVQGCLNSILSGLVLADSRLIEDLSDELEDCEMNLLFIIEAVDCLVSCFQV